jgi:imidazole glycerol-phosphate synthase subunit HisF
VPKRIIPCLDVKDGKVVKGKAFVDLQHAGDPVELARFYSEEGADELVFLDISASEEGRKTVVDLVKRTAAEVKIPFCVGGGINSLEVMKSLFDAGADKLSINTPAVLDPGFISRATAEFGKKIVVAIDAQWNEALNDWEVYSHGGKKPTGRKAVEWAAEAEKLGACEILLTSIDRDGHKDGYDLEVTSAVARGVSIPVIASGGAGKLEHFYDAVTKGGADAVLAASVFHYRVFSIKEVKHYLQNRGIEVHPD